MHHRTDDNTARSARLSRLMPRDVLLYLVFGLKWEADEDVDVLLEWRSEPLPQHRLVCDKRYRHDGSDEWTVDAYVDSAAR